MELGGDIHGVEFTKSNKFYNEVVIEINMFCMFMRNMILSHKEGTFIVTH